MSGLAWASCPEGQEEDDRTSECKPSSKVKKSLSSGSGWGFGRSLPLGAKKHGYQVVSAPDHPVRYGQYSEKFEVRPGDCSKGMGGHDDCKTDRERSELIQRYETQKRGDEYWYRWSIYLPPTHQNIHRVKVAYCQFHQEGCLPVVMFQ